MSVDRNRHTLAKAVTRKRNVFFFWYAAGLALILGVTSVSAAAQQPIVNPKTGVSAQAQPGQTSVPPTLALAEGMAIQVRTADYLSSEDDGNGAHFIGTLARPVVVDGWLVAHAGQYIVGEVASSDKNRGFELHLNQLILEDGELVRIQTAAVIAAKGTPPQSPLTFNLAKAVSFSTLRGRVAFRAVIAEDYTNFPLGSAPVQIPFGYDPPCCVDQHGYGAFAGDGYGYPYYYGAGYFPPPIQIRYYGWHGNRWGW